MCLITMLAVNVLITLTNSQPSTTLRVLLRGQDTGLANKPMRSCSPYGGRAKPGEISRQNETNIDKQFISHRSKKRWIYQPTTLLYLVCRYTIHHDISGAFFFAQEIQITPDSSAMKFWPNLQCIQHGTKELSNRKWNLRKTHVIPMWYPREGSVASQNLINPWDPNCLS